MNAFLRRCDLSLKQRCFSLLIITKSVKTAFCKSFETVADNNRLIKRATIWQMLLGFFGGEEHSGRSWWLGFNLSLLMEHNRGHRYFRMPTISHLFYLFQESSTSLCCVCKERLIVIWVSVNFTISNYVFAYWLNYQTKFCFPSCAWRWHICQVNFAMILL